MDTHLPDEVPESRTRNVLEWYFAARDAGMPAWTEPEGALLFGPGSEWWEAMYLRYFTPPGGGA